MGIGALGVDRCFGVGRWELRVNIWIILCMCLAIPGQIVSPVPGSDTLVVVDVAGIRRRVDVALLESDPPVPGDWVLIHVGFAMCKISEAEAADQMRTLALLGEHDAAVSEVRGYGLDGESPVTEEPPV
jgi:hydrogenase expression/formation protein HypC